jgi:hypothetical protein
MFYWKATFVNRKSKLYLTVFGSHLYETPEQADKEFQHLIRNDIWLISKGVTAEHEFVSAELVPSKPC